MRESKGICASYEPQSIPRLVFGLKLSTSLLGHTCLCTEPEDFWTETHGKKGFIWSHLTVIWIYKLDFSSITPDHPLLSQ